MADKLKLLVCDNPMGGDEGVVEVSSWAGGNFQINFEGKTDPGNDRLEYPRMVDGRAASVLDESTPDGVGEADPPPLRLASASAAATASAPMSRKKEEEEDVLLDG